MFEDLFIDPGTIARYRSTPLLAERLSYRGALRTRGRCDGGHCARSRLIRPGWFIFSTYVRPHSSACAGSRRWRCNGASRRAPARIAPHDRVHVRDLSGTRYDGCVSWCFAPKNASRDATRPRWRDRGVRGAGCERSADGPQRRSAVAWRWSSASAMDSMSATSPWLRSGSPTSTRQSHAGSAGGAADSHPQLCATSSHLFPVRRTPGVVHAGLAGEDHGPLRFHPSETVPQGLSRDEVLQYCSQPPTSDHPVDVRDRAITAGC